MIFGIWIKERATAIRHKGKFPVCNLFRPFGFVGDKPSRHVKSFVFQEVRLKMFTATSAAFGAPEVRFAVPFLLCSFNTSVRRLGLYQNIVFLSPLDSFKYRGNLRIHIRLVEEMRHDNRRALSSGYGE